MKNLLLLPGFVVVLSLNQLPRDYDFCGTLTDTSHIVHVLDGNTDEWPDTMFQTDKETSAHYAIDNDGHQLYLALRIPDFRTQMKLMRQGMNLYIDLRGKRKEGRGIEFPLKSESGDPTPPMSNQRGDDQHGKFDKKAFRESQALHLLGMKLIGFGDGEPYTQALGVEGSANIQFNWDSSDVMHIEYRIPFSILSEGNSLDQKTIGVGWKINGVVRPGNNVVSSTTSLQGRPSGGNGPRTPSRGTVGASDPFAEAGSSDKPIGEQSFWTKYTVHQ